MGEHTVLSLSQILGQFVSSVTLPPWKITLNCLVWCNLRYLSILIPGRLRIENKDNGVKEEEEDRSHWSWLRLGPRSPESVCLIVGGSVCWGLTLHCPTKHRSQEIQPLPRLSPFLSVVGSNNCLQRWYCWDLLFLTLSPCSFDTFLSLGNLFLLMDSTNIISSASLSHN